MDNSIFDFGNVLGFKSPFERWISPLSSEVTNKGKANIQITSIEGPSIICEGAVYEFKIVDFNNQATNIDFTKLLEKIIWAYEIDGNGISRISQKAIINSAKNEIILKWKIPKLNKGSFLKIYVWTDQPNNAVFTSSQILSFPFFFDRYKIKGLDQTATKLADDLCYGDGITKTDHSVYSISEIEALGDKMKNETLLKKTEDLWKDLIDMVTLEFSIRDLGKDTLKMIRNFKDNAGLEFSNSNLTSEILKHKSTKEFCNRIEDCIKAQLNLSNCNPASLKDEFIYLETINRFGRPSFKEFFDTIGGLRIMWNDTWAYEIYVTNFDTNDGVNYNVEYKVVLYDHFGLDKPDLEKIYYYHQGFRAWFVLQHVRNFKPFITKAEFDKSFAGNISEKGKLILKRQKNYV